MLTPVPTSAPPIVFASDFGYRNEWVGICHAVMGRIAPESQIVDLSHGIPPLDVLAGALLLVDSLPYIAEDAIIIAVVDPTVGRDRDIAVQAENGRLLVGPDNGLLAPACASLGGIRRLVEITSSEVILEPVSPSFHARDILCPAAAHLAVGLNIEHLGQLIGAENLAQLKVPEAEVAPGKIECEVLDLNRFGNLQLSAREDHLVAAGLDPLKDVAIESTSASARARRASTYADVESGQYGLMLDPRGWLAVIRGNPANAAEGLGLQVGDLVWITAPPDVE
jgi:S-adenosylmethionine hydrolase